MNAVNSKNNTSDMMILTNSGLEESVLLKFWFGFVEHGVADKLAEAKVDIDLRAAEEARVVRLRVRRLRHVLNAVGQLQLYGARLQPHRRVTWRRRRQLDALSHMKPSS